MSEHHSVEPGFEGNELVSGAVSAVRLMLMIWLAIPLIAMIFVFTIGCFTAGVDDYTQWSVGSRVWAVVCWFVFSFMGIAGTFSILEQWTGYPQKITQLNNLSREMINKNTSLQHQITNMKKKQEREEKASKQITRKMLENGPKT